MKSSLYKQFLSIFLTALLFMCLVRQLPAQPPPEADPSRGGSEKPVGQDAPIGGGLLILVALGAVYGVRKYYVSEKGR